MISKSTDYVVLDVLPSDHETLPEQRRLDFADYDLCAPPLFVTIGLFFPLSPHSDKDKIISDLQTGLAHTLEQIPIFAGKIQHDPETQRHYVLQKNTDTITLAVRHLDSPTSSFPSLSQWEKAGFPDTEMRQYQQQLCPPGVESSDLPMGVRSEPGCVMSAFQINFVRGGVLLMAVLHHYQADATSIDKFCNAWADNSKAFANGSSFLSKFKPSFDRTYFTMPEKTSSTERVEKLVQGLGVFKLFDIAPPEATPPPPDASTEVPTKPQPVITTRTLHFSKQNCDRIKKLAAPSEPGKFVSTYDCIVALVWRAMTRARKSVHPDWDTKTLQTRLASAVTMRDRFTVTSRDYIGNGVAASQTDAIIVDDLLSSQIGTAALMSRDSILKVTPSTIPELLEVAKAMHGKKQMMLDASFHFGPDVLATSWTKMNVYNYDFGFGLPISFRALPPPMEGVLAVHPRCTSRGEEEGFEVCTMIEQPCSELLSQDKELLQFSEIRGGGRIE